MFSKEFQIFKTTFLRQFEMTTCYDKSDALSHDGYH